MALEGCRFPRRPSFATNFSLKRFWIYCAIETQKAEHEIELHSSIFPTYTDRIL